MYLHSVNIKRFRSIEDASLINCGEFNVLIGKNNAGKSNLLSAIDTFFSCLQDGKVLTLEPPIGNEIDFFSKNTNAPIEITLSFTLSLAERDSLVSDIVTEAPQMKHAVEGIEPNLLLVVTVKVTSPPNRFGYVSKLSVRSISESENRSVGSERRILDIPDDSAKELYDQQFLLRQQTTNAQALSNIDASSARLLLEYKTEARGRTPVDFLLRQSLSFGNSLTTPVSKELRATLEKIVDEASSPDELVNEIRALVTRIQEEASRTIETPLRNKIGTFAGEEVAVPQYVHNLLRGIAALRVLYLRERRKIIGKEEAKRLLDLKVRRGGTEALRNIQETVTSLLGVQIDAFQSDVVSSRSESVAELDVDNFLVQVNGSGIREALRLVLDYEFEHPKILLVEEPEVHLHPALETGLLRYLKQISNDCQVFLTTHSTNFLDTSDMKNVYLVSKREATEVKAINVEEAETQIPRELGLRLSSFFMFDRLVFVEGVSDEDIIREWASTLGVNLSQANVGFIQMAGARNYTHFASEKILSFLTKRQVKLWFIIDRDEREDEELAKIKTTLGDKASVKVLKKREIENYLINTRVIKEYISSHRKLSGVSNGDEMTEEDVKTAIDECAEALKQTSIDKRISKILFQPIYADRAKVLNEKSDTSILERCVTELKTIISSLEAKIETIEQVANEQVELVNNQWPTNKLTIIPGDTLLDMVFKKFKLRFLKERDGARLAALMRDSEIDSEIKSIIRELGT